MDCNTSLCNATDNGTKVTNISLEASTIHPSLYRCHVYSLVCDVVIQYFLLLCGVTGKCLKLHNLIYDIRNMFVFEKFFFCS
jgi:hypothetical protein